MKKTIAIFALLFSTVFTTLNASEVTGETIYKLKCASCHMLDIPKDMSDANHSKMMKDMKAPPFSKVSAKVKDAFDNNESKAIAFVADYIVNPDENKSLCMPQAIKAFGLMPSIGKDMSKGDIALVSKWLVTNFKTPWKVTQKGARCQGKIKCDKPDCDGKKCGDGKCGSDKNASKKCGEGKCGGDKNTSKKCGGGK